MGGVAINGAIYGTEEATFMKDKLFPALLIGTLLGCFYLGVFVGWKEMIGFAMCGAVCLFFLTRDKSLKFDLWGAKAELQGLIQENYATLGELRLLATTLIEFTSDFIVSEGQYAGGMEMPRKLEMRETLDDISDKLGLRECASLHETETRFHRWMLWILAVNLRIAIESEFKGNNEKRQLIKEHLSFPDQNAPEFKDLCQRISNIDSMLESAYKEELLDYQHYETYHKLRRPEMYRRREISSWMRGQQRLTQKA